MVGYLFTLAALGAQVYIFHTAFTKGAGVSSKFYGWPFARVGALYLAVQLVLGLVFMGAGRLPLPKALMIAPAPEHDWLNYHTGIQLASKVQSLAGLLFHIFSRLTAALFLFHFYS